jgi:peptide/nickel transport system ATP-binding protein
LAEAERAPLLSVQNLRVEFPTRRGVLVAVHDVSFEIGAGEVLGVVGESGAGKSLTGAAIIGLLDAPGRVAAGRITLSGRRIDNLPYEAMRRIRGREIGAIFQDPLTSLNPLYTVGQQLVETIRTHLDLSDAQARSRAVGLLEEVGIPAAARRIGHYPHQFSGGMRQRVVIALALAANPRLIIADEPTTALDVSIQAQIIQLLKRLCREHGTAVMLITHDMGVIAETADRVAVMYAGRIVEIGPVADVIHRPQHPYTVGLMGSIPSIADERERLTQIDGSMPRLSAIPSGCPFHPRCPHAFVRCSRERPELMSTAGPPQGANCAPSGGVGAHTSTAGPPQGANCAPSGGMGAHTSTAGPSQDANCAPWGGVGAHTSTAGPSQRAGATHAACWLHDPVARLEADQKIERRPRETAQVEVDDAGIPAVERTGFRGADSVFDIGHGRNE